jgi:hypothetical protein
MCVRMHAHACMCVYSEKLNHPLHQLLMMEAETFSKMLEIQSILIWLIAQEDLIINYHFAVLRVVLELESV